MSETPYLKLQLTPSSEWDTKKYGDFITELAGSDETSTLQKIDTAIKNVNDDLTSHEGDSISHITADERNAWNRKASATHASQHSASGSDPITPADIGAVAVGDTVNPNILDNGYFGNPVNQRGLTEYNTGVPAIYTIDRWQARNADGSVVVEGDGVRVTCASTAYNLYFEQYIEPTADDVPVYASALVTEVTGTVYMQLVYTDGTYSTSGGALKAGLKEIQCTKPVNRVMFQINKNGGSVNIKSVKLEYGTQQTLAHKDTSGNWVLNEIPDYNEEFLKCIQSTADTHDTYANKVVATQDWAVAKSEKGVAGGIASLGSDGKVPSAQLPDLNYAPSTHASQHGASGSDPVTPAAIGAYPNGSKGAVNCNNLSDGAWTISASATNGPGAFACTLFHKDWNVDFASQIAFGADRNVYYRVKTSGSWLAWQEMYSTLRYPSPSKIGALPITGGTVTGHLNVKSFSLSDYSSAIEIGKNIDFHLNGSTNDFDARLAYDSGDLLFRLLGGDYKTILHTGNLSDNNISRMTLISYTGTGTSGESNKTTITCPAPPKMVIVFRKGTSLAPASKDTIGSEGDDCWGNGFMWTYGAYDVAIYEGAQARILEFTQSGNTLSWYANLASAQQNSSGDTYYALVWY